MVNWQLAIDNFYDFLLMFVVNTAVRHHFNHPRYRMGAVKNLAKCFPIRCARIIQAVQPRRMFKIQPVRREEQVGERRFRTKLSSPNRIS